MKDKSDGMLIRLTNENWGRGDTGGALRYCGRYCILGHALRQIGAEPGEDTGMPTREQEDLLRQAGLINLRALMDVNDGSCGSFRELADADRVERFNELLAGTGWEVVFEQGSEQ